MSAIDVEADAKGAPKIQAKTALDAKSSLQLLEKYIAFDSQGGEAAAQATHQLSIAIGTRAQANGNVAIALGHAARALAVDAIAIGVDCVADEYSGIMLGNHGAAGSLATALGSAARATHARSVALGSRSVTDQENTVSVGSVEQRRAIRFVADGELAGSSHEAVTGRQLFATNQKVDASEAAIAANTENIHTATSQIKELSDQVNSGSVGLIQQDPASRALKIGATTDGTLIDAAGTRGPRRLSGLAEGHEASDAATYGQLMAVSQDPLLARYDNPERTQLTLNPGNTPTRLSNVAAAVAGSDAINMDQFGGAVRPLSDDVIALKSQQQEQGQALADLREQSVQYADSSWRRVELQGGENGTILSNVANGESAADAVNKRQLDAVNKKVTGFEGALRDVVNQVDDLDIYAVKHDQGSGDIPAGGAKITDLADGTASRDAVNKSQLDDAIAPFQQKLADAVSYSNSAHTLVTLNPSQPAVRLTNLADGAVAGDAVNFGQISPVLAKVRLLDLTGNGAAEALGQGAVAAGDQARADGNNSIAVGTGANAKETFDVAIGRHAKAAGETSGSTAYAGVAIGSGAETASSAVALGQVAKGLANGAVALGPSAKAEQYQALAIGHFAAASTKGSVALGPQAKSSAANAVALGSKSVADEDDTVSIGNRNGLKRRLTNVAEAIDDDDATTLGQFRQLRFAHEQLQRDFEHLQQQYGSLHELVRELDARVG